MKLVQDEIITIKRIKDGTTLSVGDETQYGRIGGFKINQQDNNECFITAAIYHKERFLWDGCLGGLILKTKKKKRTWLNSLSFHP